MEGSGSSIIFAINLAFFFLGTEDNTTRNLKDSWSSGRGLRHSNTLSNYSHKKIISNENNKIGGQMDVFLSLLCLQCYPQPNANCSISEIICVAKRVFLSVRSTLSAHPLPHPTVKLSLLFERCS